MHGLGGVRTGRDRAAHGDAVELLEEVEVEPRSPELAVGDAPDPGGFELGDHVGDGRILDRAQLGVVDLADRVAALAS